MEKFPIEISKDSITYKFEIVDYLHHEGDRCKVEVYREGKLVAGLDPHPHDYLQVCKNPGNVDKEVLHLLIEKLESHHF
jgi:hypothetical protein